MRVWKSEVGRMGRGHEIGGYVFGDVLGAAFA